MDKVGEIRLSMLNDKHKDNCDVDVDDVDDDDDDDDESDIHFNILTFTVYQSVV
jgi:hypothetical protein